MQQQCWSIGRCCLLLGVGSGVDELLFQMDWPRRMRSLLERFNSHDGLLINIVISLCVYIQSMFSVYSPDPATNNCLCQTPSARRL